MRAQEFISEAIQQKGNHVVFNEPWDEKKEAENNETFAMRIYREINGGQIPAEIAALKGADGLYNVNGVTRSLITGLMDKYPAAGSPFWGNIYKKSSPADYEKTIGEITDRLKKVLADSNEFAAPKSRFFWPNRPMPANAVGGYRGDGRTGKVENLAKQFDPTDLKFYMSAVKWAVSRRYMDPMPPDQWLMILLTEGRDDFGFNLGQWDRQKGPAWAKFEEQLKQAGLVNRAQIGFVALTKSKMDLVKRSGISFYQAWNGGAANLANYNAQATAVKDPRNKPLLDVITSALA
jgi:hypothetical protein